MTVGDLGCASSVVCAERFRTVAKSFTAGAHTPADLALAATNILAAGPAADLADLREWLSARGAGMAGMVSRAGRQ
jgi:hypothetical protein